jgi:hypothetical protein
MPHVVLWPMASPIRLRTCCDQEVRCRHRSQRGGLLAHATGRSIRLLLRLGVSAPSQIGSCSRARRAWSVS